jgi:hypothetical protein
MHVLVAGREMGHEWLHFVPRILLLLECIKYVGWLPDHHSLYKWFAGAIAFHISYTAVQQRNDQSFCYITSVSKDLLMKMILKKHKNIKQSQYEGNVHNVIKFCNEERKKLLIPSFRSVTFLILILLLSLCTAVMTAVLRTSSWSKWVGCVTGC